MTDIGDLASVFDALKIPITNKFVLIIIFILAIAMIIRAISDILECFRKFSKYFRTKFYDLETKQFIQFRTSFVENLKNDIIRLNNESNWSDFYYTDLEAEVEVDPAVDLAYQNATSRVKVIIQKIFFYIYVFRNSIGLPNRNKIEKNLIYAILKSKSHSFLVIGDPGSGKTVSLRHLFLKMAERAISSKDNNATVPIYLNLKLLTLKADELSDEGIRKWIIKELRAGKARGIYDFLDNNYERMLIEGNFFFIFDSFDEIPSVLDAQEHEQVVQAYAKALDGFIHSYKCRGLVSSRPYRSPKIFIGQRMTIRPLTDQRIRKALNQFLVQYPLLAKELWQQLSSIRIDLLNIASNPFYLGLLADYAKVNKKLPGIYYDLFENFVGNRAEIDHTRIKQFDLSSSELIIKASLVAYSMTKAKDIGLEAEVTKILVAINEVPGEEEWNYDALDSLLNALSFSMFGKLSVKETNNLRVFTFVHRRFQEYFTARYIRENNKVVPIEYLAADNRWREVLVLLCEVMPREGFHSIFDFIRTHLEKGISAESGSSEHRKAIEIIRFLRDAFRSRMDDIPEDIRRYCSEFIKSQLIYGIRLDQKRAIESISIADEKSIQNLFEKTFKIDSDWLWETAIRSCRILGLISNSISESILSYLYCKYINLNYQDYFSYSVIFSSKILHPFKIYLRLLLMSGLLQLVTYITFFIYGLIFDIYLSAFIIILLIFIFSIKKIIDLENERYGHQIIGLNLILVNPWIYIAGISIFYPTMSLVGKIFVIFNIVIYILIYGYPFTLKSLFSIPTKLICYSRPYIAKELIFLALIAGIIVYYTKEKFDLMFSKIYGLFPEYISILFLAILILYFGLGFIRWVYFRIYDQIKLRRLNMSYNLRPRTTTEAIQMLCEFKSDLGKKQYLHALCNWLSMAV